MRVTLESTDQVIEFMINGENVPARIWEGATEGGIPVVCFITRIVPNVPEPLPPEIATEFAAQLKEVRPPSPEARHVFDLRMIL